MEEEYYGIPLVCYSILFELVDKNIVTLEKSIYCFILHSYL